MVENSKSSELNLLPSKAATEVAMAAIGGASDGLKETIKDVWGGIVGDRVREWRKRNLVNALEQTARYLRSKGVNLADARHLPDGEVYRLFEGSSKSDTPSISEMWAKLLASAMDPKSQIKVDEALSKVLEQLIGNDAELFLIIYRHDVDISALEQRKEIEFGALMRKLKSAQKLYSEKRIDGATMDALEREVVIENEKLVTGLGERVRRIGSDLSQKISGIGDIEASKANLVRLGLIVRNELELNLPDLFVDREFNGTPFGESDYVRSVESMKEWMFLMLERSNEDAKLKIINDDGFRSTLNYRTSDFGHRFAEACVVEEG